METLSIFLVIFGLYVFMLIAAARWGWSQTRAGAEDDFLTGGRSLNWGLGMFTYGATLFSTFTLLGMPNFFRTHGVGAWIFLGVTDVAMAFVVLWFGVALRKKAKDGARSVFEALSLRGGSPLARWVYLLGIVIFLLPYIAVQIKGVAEFASAAIPLGLEPWHWALALVAAMVLYSEFGGFRGVVYSDAVQGMLLLVVVLIVANVLLGKSGGMGGLMEQVQQTNPALLSTPGPKGLFSMPFLLASFIAIVLMPITQPQLTSRIMFMRSERELRWMAVALGVFAMLIIVPTVIIGLYGAVAYAGDTTPEFWTGVLISEQPSVVGALALVGLLAAAMSTADSQLFALGAEVESAARNKSSGVRLRVAKLWVVLFALIAFGIAMNTTEGLVLLARKGIAGTALLAPMLLAGLLLRRPLGHLLPAATFLALLLFLSTQLGLVNDGMSKFSGWPLDFILILGLSVVATVLVVKERSVASNVD